MKKNSKSKYKYLLNELLTKIRTLGFVVDFEKGDRIEVEGYFLPISKKIIIKYNFKKSNKIDILFTLGHEYRHLEHFKFKKFSKYYSKNGIKQFNKLSIIKENLIKNNITPSLAKTLFNLKKTKLNLSLGVRAERDCDRWSITYLKSHKLNIRRDLYPSYATLYGKIKALEADLGV